MERQRCNTGNRKCCDALKGVTMQVLLHSIFLCLLAIFLAASSGDGTVRVYAMSDSAKSSYKLHRSLTMEDIAGDADPNEDSQYQVFNWNCCDGEVLHCAFSPDLKTLVACCDDGVVRLYNWDNPNAPPVALDGHTDAVTSCSFVRGNSTTMATVSWDGTAKLWDLEEQKCSTSYIGHEGWVRCCVRKIFTDWR